MNVTKYYYKIVYSIILLVNKLMCLFCFPPPKYLPLSLLFRISTKTSLRRQKDAKSAKRDHPTSRKKRNLERAQEL